MTQQRPAELFTVYVQSQLPTVQLSLSRVGVTGVEKVIRLRHNGSEQLFSARFECVVDLGRAQKGAHMSRFEEVVNEAINALVLGESTFKVETLAEHIAQARAEALAADRARAGARSTTMAIPIALLAAGFLLLLVFPIVYRTFVAG